MRLNSVPAYNLRPAVQDDFPAIRTLIHTVWINPLGLDWKNFILAVDAQEQMIGCGQVKLHRDGSRELASVAVVAEWRRRGVAGAIIHALLKRYPGTLFLTCRKSLGPFYERFGFRVAQPGELSPYFRRLMQAARALRLLRLMPTEGVLVMVGCGRPAEPATSPPA